MKARKENLLLLAHEYVRRLLLPLKAQGFAYHNLEHTVKVLKHTNVLIENHDLTENEQLELRLAVLFHDTGIPVDYANHEEESKKIAKKFLHKKIERASIQNILSIISATKYLSIPESITQKIIQDADLYNLADVSYFNVLKQLRKERKKIIPQKFLGKSKFRKEALEFITTHRYKTEYAIKNWETKKQGNLLELKKLINTSSKTQEAVVVSLLDDNKAGQMILKTAIRNHIDLSSLADSKASTMLSVNTLILTLALPLMIPRISDNPLLGIPTAILMITSIISIIFATLVTRPIKMKGFTSIEESQNGKGDLFFFGNFFNMNFSQYLSGMKATLSNSKNLDESIIRDLFGSGQALGGKYEKLRMCYMVFMTGIIIAGIGFLIILATGI